MSVGVVLSSFIFFGIMRAMLTRLPLPATVQQAWRWFNVWISWLHALIAGSGCLYCLIKDPKLLTSLHHYDCHLAYNLVEISTGYFFYDALDVIFAPVKQSFILLCHHFVVITCFGLVVVTGNHVPIAIISLLVEINSVFLHTRQILRITKLQDGTIYAVNKFANLTTFFVFRFVTLVWMLGRVVRYHKEISQPYLIVLTLGFPIMILINFGLFLQVLAKDVPTIALLQKLQQMWKPKQTQNYNRTSRAVAGQQFQNYVNSNGTEIDGNKKCN